MSLLTEVVDYLATELSLSAGSTIFETQLPPTPDAVMSVQETGGAPPDRQLGATTALFSFPTIRLLCRGAADDYTTPRAQAKTAWEKLLAINPQTTLGSTAYQFVTPMSEPHALERDSKGRIIIGFNCQVQKDPS
jgi:hypothetical protein